MAKSKINDLTPEQIAAKTPEELAKFKLTSEQLELLTPEEIADYKREKNKSLRQALKYAVCTASAGLIQFVSFTIMTKAIPDNMGDMWFMIPMRTQLFLCTTVALVLSVLWNFTINRKFTFKSAGNVPRAMFLAFLFYVPFYPFQTWYVATVTQALGGGDWSLIAEATVMLINGILEFCWQKFFIYRKEADSALEKYSVGTVGEFGEITPQADAFSGEELYEMLSAGVDINATDDKHLAKWLKKNS